MLAVSVYDTGASRCQGCPPEESPWSGLLALLVVYFAVIVLVVGNVVLLVIVLLRLVVVLVRLSLDTTRARRTVLIGDCSRPTGADRDG